MASDLSRPTPAPAAPPPTPPSDARPSFPASVTAVIRALMRALTPHTTTFRIAVRTDAYVVAFVVPKSVTLQRHHLRAAFRAYHGTVPWVQWMDEGLLLCAKVPRRSAEDQDPDTELAGRVETAAARALCSVATAPPPAKRARTDNEA